MTIRTRGGVGRKKSGKKKNKGKILAKLSGERKKGQQEERRKGGVGNKRRKQENTR
jgi:hypothetical protein